MKTLKSFIKEFKWSSAAMIAMAGFLGLYYGKVVATPSEQNVEILADLLLIIGAWLIASGATLSCQNRAFLFELRKQEEEVYAKRLELLKLKLLVATAFAQLASSEAITGLEVDKVQSEIADVKSLKLKFISQKNLAKILIDTSDKTSAGTILLVAGTIILMLKVLAPLVTRHP